jgi:hypothetical protein
MTRCVRPFLLVILALAVTVVVTPPAAAQDDPAQRLSPIGIARTHIGDSYVKVTYGRPYIRERLIFGPPADQNGPLVPFSRVWRTGANEATEITVTGPVLMAGQRLEPGTYSVFTRPGADVWTVYLSSDLGLDGTGRFDPATETFTPVFDPDQALLTLQVPAARLAEPVDPFTIVFEPTARGADLVLRWDRTEVRVPLAPGQAR